MVKDSDALVDDQGSVIRLLKTITPTAVSRNRTHSSSIHDHPKSMLNTLISLFLTHTHAHTYIHTHINIYTHVPAYIQTYTNIETHTYLHIYTRQHTHTEEKF